MQLDAEKPKDETNKPQPTPEELEAAAKKAADSNGGDDESGQEPDDSLIPEALKPYVSKLRKENAKYRTKAKNLEGSNVEKEEKLARYQKAMAILGGDEEGKEVDPETQIQHLSGAVQHMEIENAILQSAYMNGIPHEQVGYYRYLLSQKLEGMEEGEELTDEEMEEIVGEVQLVAGKKSAASATGVNGKGANKAPSGGASITVEQFKAMSTTEKSQLYAKDQSLYLSLVEQAKK